ncbi:MAG: phosphoglycerate dehydrogenase [Promethearchaeota archaeon]
MEQKKYRILISDSITEEGINFLEKNKKFEVDVKTGLSKEELMEIIGRYHGIIIRSGTKITSDVLTAAKNLKVIARAGTGYDNINVEECTKRGIVVMITPLGNSNAVVELTIGLMLDYARNIARANALMEAGRWEKKKLRGTELKEKTVGIIGLGNIGAGVAKRCLAFEMNVIAYDKFIPKKRAENLGVKLVKELDELLMQADYITFHIPLTEQTKNMIDTPQFEKMKKNVVLVNVARGGVINEQSLYEALLEKKIGGACIDVYSNEPANLKDFPFIKLDNVVTTPHLGANTFEAQIRVGKLAAEHIVTSLISKIFIDAVNVPFKLSEDKVDIYRPFMKLGGSLGSFISQYNTGKVTEVTIRYKGESFTDFKPLKAVILYSIFNEKLTEDVTYMNIDKVLSEHGIGVVIERYRKQINFEDYIKVYINTEDGKRTKIAGTVFSEKPKIVEIDNLYFDFSPSPNMLVLENTDTPGVVGQVGSLLGTLGINIANIQLSRKKSIKKALSLISIDEPITKRGLEQLRKLPQVLDAKNISL